MIASITAKNRAYIMEARIMILLWWKNASAITLLGLWETFLDFESKLGGERPATRRNETPEMPKQTDPPTRVKSEPYTAEWSVPPMNSFQNAM
jgi:hypothetical protein